MPPTRSLRPINPDNARGLCITAPAGTELGTPYSYGTINPDKRAFSRRKAVYNPKTFFLHAASLHQAFAHCGIFSTAATRRCTSRISVSSLGADLSVPLPVIALVSRYLTNKLIGPRPIIERFTSLLRRSCEVGDYLELPRLSASYAKLYGMYQGITNSFATDTILDVITNCIRSTCMPYPRRQRSS